MTRSIAGSSSRAGADDVTERPSERERAIANRRRSAQLAIKASEVTGEPVSERVRQIAAGRVG